MAGKALELGGSIRIARIKGLFPLRREQTVAPRLGMAETVRSVVLSEFRRQMEPRAAGRTGQGL